MATDKADDLTAERADLKEIARKLVLQINEITPAQWDKQDDKDQAIIIAAIKTARQEALREASDLIKLMPMLTAHNVAAVLDRLAREGGTE